MEEKKIIPNVKKDRLCWLLIFLLVALGVVTSYYIREYTWSLKFIFWLLLTAAVATLAFITSQGRKFLIFINGATMELRKVVWPTRDETTKITAIVAALVFTMSIILWILDTFLLWIFRWFTK